MSYQKNPFFYITGLLFFLCVGSCENAPSPETRLDFAVGSGLTAENKVVSAGEIINTSLFGRTGSGNKFKKFKIMYAYDGADSIPYLDSILTVTSEEFSFYFTFGARAVTGKEKWTFHLEDENGALHTKEYLLSTTGNASPLFNLSSSFLHYNNFRNLPYFSISDGTTHSAYAFKKIQTVKDRVSFGFLPGTTSDTLVNLIAANETKFKTTSLTTENFNSTNTAEAIIAAYNAATSPEINTFLNLAEGQIITFKTKGNKSGLIRIENYETVRDLNLNKDKLLRMRYQVKVEKS